MHDASGGIHHHPHLTSPAKCKVYMFGSLRVELFGQLVCSDGWKSNKALSLFKILLTRRGEGVSREALIDYLWPELPEENAVRSLHTTVYFLRRALSEYSDGKDIIDFRKGAYRFNPPETCWYDTAEFEQSFSMGYDQFQSGQEGALMHFKRVSKLYQGAFLADDPYAEWADELRENYRSMYVQATFEAARIYCGDGRLSAAMALYEKLIEEDPYRDDIHDAYLDCLMKAGRFAKAVQHYNDYRQMLLDDLGIEPSGEMSEKFREVLGQITLSRSSNDKSVQSPRILVVLPSCGGDMAQALKKLLTRSLKDLPGSSYDVDIIGYTHEDGIAMTEGEARSIS